MQNQADTALREKAFKFALLNALLHGGKAQVQAVVGKVLGEMPEYRGQAREVVRLVAEVVEEVNSLGAQGQRRILEERWPDALAPPKPPEREERRLPPLPNAEKYATVVTRFSPNPDCVLHLGSARAIILSHDYARLYRGRFYLRFEDTDPKQKRPAPEFYDRIREDLRWLGCQWDAEFTQSERLELYYHYARQLLERGGAYVCTCAVEEFRRLASASQPCPCRGLPFETQLARWEDMLAGRYREGEAVLRVKTDLSHPNPAVRDWPALRIIDTTRHPHPRVDDKYRVWPLYNLATGLDDHLMGITHIIRGKEHLTNEVRQRFLYAHLGWEYPETIHYGRLKIRGGVLSKSKIKAGVGSGTYAGYDDPRLATFGALRRRGIRPEAVRRMILEVGPKNTDIILSWETLYSHNRSLIDAEANRYFFVHSPFTLVVEGVERSYTPRLPLHPDHPERGFRSLNVQPTDGRAELLVSKADLKLLQPAGMVRLMGLFNVKVLEVNEAERLVRAAFHSEAVEEARRLRAPLIHYLPKPAGARAFVVMPNAKEARGYVEETCRRLRVGEVVQFERFGFARLDGLEGSALRFYYAHK